jgi:hypothetical protein
MLSLRPDSNPDEVCREMLEAIRLMRDCAKQADICVWTMQPQEGEIEQGVEQCMEFFSIWSSQMGNVGLVRHRRPDYERLLIPLKSISLTAAQIVIAVRTLPKPCASLCENSGRAGGLEKRLLISQSVSRWKKFFAFGFEMGYRSVPFVKFNRKKSARISFNSSLASVLGSSPGAARVSDCKPA